VPREFSSLSLPGSHCSCAPAKFSFLCNLPRGAENKCFLRIQTVLLFLDAHLGWSSSYTQGIRFLKVLSTNSFIVVFVARFSQELSNQHAPRM